MRANPDLVDECRGNAYTGDDGTAVRLGDRPVLDKATRTSITNAVNHEFTFERVEGGYRITDKDDSASGYSHTLLEFENGYRCDCKGFEYRGNCKHVRALNLHFLRSGFSDCAKPAQIIVEDDSGQGQEKGHGQVR